MGRTVRLDVVFACGGVLWCAGGAIVAAISVAQCAYVCVCCGR